MWKNTGEVKPRPVIWMTDWWTDVDDVMAARVLYWAELKGMVDIVGVVSNCSNGQIIPSIDAFFEAEGRRGIPMAVDTNAGAAGFGGTPGPPYQTTMLKWRHQYTSDATAESDITFLRRALANSLTPIDIIAVGYSNNLSNLLNSPADSISPLTGLQLAQQKVAHLWIMGGQYPSGTENNFSRNAYAMAAAYNVITNWPTPITFLGVEVGTTVTAGDTVQTNWPAADDLLSQALVDYNVSHGNPVGSGRASWDPMLVLLACLGDPHVANYTPVYGTNTLNQSTGANTFIANTNGKHRYIVKRRTDNWYKLTLNNILNKLDWPVRDTIGAQQLPKPSRISGVVDSANLLAYWCADDLQGNTDGASVYHLEDRTGKNHMRSVSGERPTYKASIGGKAAVNFAGAQRMTTDNVNSQSSMTIYTKVYFDTLPASNQTVLAQDDLTTPGKLWHAKFVSPGNFQAVDWDAVGSKANTTSNAVATGGWYVATMTISPTQLTAFLNGTTGSATATGTPITGTVPVSMGGRAASGAMLEPFTGYVNQARIYQGVHDATTIQSVINEMS